MPSHIVSFSDSACAGGAASVAIAADMVTAIEATLKHIMSLHNWTLWTGYLTFADARLPTALPLPFTPGDFGVPRWLLASKTTIDSEGKQARGWRQELCRFSAAGMTVSPRTPTAGGRKAPRQEIAGWERRWCRNYGDFAAGAGVDVAERGGKVRNFGTRHGRELGCERVTDRLCNAILRFWVSPNGNIDVTMQGITLSAGSQHRH